jgi:O-antigen/teichoic acid export membrane protein
MVHREKTSTLTSNTVFYGISSLVERVISFIMIPLLTKTLAQELYGVWTQIIVTLGFLSPLILLGFASASVRFLAGEHDKEKISSIFHAMFLTTSVLCVFVLLFLSVFTPGVSRLMFGSLKFSDFVLIFGLLLVSEAMFELTMSFLRSENHIKLLSLYYLLKNCGRLLILGLGIMVLKIYFPLVIMIIVIFQLSLVFFVYFIHILRKIGIKLSSIKTHWKKILLFSLPLLPYGLLIWGNNFIDRYLILHIIGLKQLSVYALSYSLAAAVSLFYSILGFTLYPHVAKLWNIGDKAGVVSVISKSLQLYLFFCVPFVVILAVFSPQIIRLISTPEYISSWLVVLLLSGGIVFFGLHQLSIYPILLNDRTIETFKLAGLALLFNLLLNLLFISVLGIIGAALANFSSNFLLAALTIIMSKKQLELKLPWKVFGRTLVYGVFMVLFISGLKYFTRISGANSLILAILLSLVFYALLDILSKDSLLNRLRRSL